MNRIAILQEMGISTWVSRETSTEISVLPLEKTPINATNAKGLEIQAPGLEAPIVITNEDESIHQRADLLMHWTLVIDSSIGQCDVLFKKIIRSIEDLGTNCQVFQFDQNNYKVGDFEGELVLAFGEKAGRLLSGENDRLENLRGILFEALNKEGEDIPVIMTYHPKDLLSNSSLKPKLWDDVLWARSIWLETQL